MDVNDRQRQSLIDVLRNPGQQTASPPTEARDGSPAFGVVLVTTCKVILALILILSAVVVVAVTVDQFLWSFTG